MASARCAPGTEAAVAAIPTTIPARTSTVPARLFATVPTTLVGIMTSEDVPLATRSLMAKTATIAGTVMIPLPMPKRPDAMPMTSPRVT